MPNFPPVSSHGQDGSQRAGQLERTLSMLHLVWVSLVAAQSQLLKTGLPFEFLTATIIVLVLAIGIGKEMIGRDASSTTEQG